MALHPTARISVQSQHRAARSGEHRHPCTTRVYRTTRPLRSLKLLVRPSPRCPASSHCGRRRSRPRRTRLPSKGHTHAAVRELARALGPKLMAKPPRCIARRLASARSKSLTRYSKWRCPSAREAPPPRLQQGLGPEPGRPPSRRYRRFCCVAPGRWCEWCAPLCVYVCRGPPPPGAWRSWRAAWSEAAG